MYVHQYVQHDWSPLAWALMLAVLAVTIFTVMGLFLVIATRSYGAGSARPTEDAGAPEPPATTAGQSAPVAPPGARIVGHH